MALDGNVLGQAIADAIMAQTPGFDAAEQAILETNWKIISVVIVAHFVASGVIIPDTFNVGGTPVVGTGKIT